MQPDIIFLYIQRYNVYGTCVQIKLLGPAKSAAKGVHTKAHVTRWQRFVLACRGYVAWRYLSCAEC